MTLCSLAWSRQWLLPYLCVTRALWACFPGLRRVRHANQQLSTFPGRSQLQRTLRCGQRERPCLRQIFFSTVGQMPRRLPATLIGRWKYLASSWMLVCPLGSCAYQSRSLIVRPKNMDSLT